MDGCSQAAARKIQYQVSSGTFHLDADEIVLVPVAFPFKVFFIGPPRDDVSRFGRNLL
jgi:hypothetical protein